MLDYRSRAVRRACNFPHVSRASVAVRSSICTYMLRLLGVGERKREINAYFETVFRVMPGISLRWEGSLVQEPSGFDCPLGPGDELSLVFQVLEDELGLPRFH